MSAACGNPMNRMSLERCLILVAISCAGVVILCISINWIFGGKIAEENHFRAIAASDPRIENISFEGYAEEFGAYTIISVSFTIRDKPNSHITLLPDGESDLNSLRLLQIGDLSPVMFEWDGRAWCPRPPTVGSDPKYRPPHPWKDLDLSRLVSHYDEVLEYFSKWSVAPNFDEITTDGGLKVQCRVDPANASTMKEFTPPGD